MDSNNPLHAARLLLAEGKLGAASSAFRASIQETPDSFEARFELGILLLNTNDAEAALAVIDEAMEIDPAHEAAMFLKGKVLQTLGRFEEAIAVYNRVLDLDPGQTAAYLQIVSSRKVVEADRPLVAQMVKMRNSGELSDQSRRYLEYALSKAHDDLGEYKEALAHCDDATRITINHPTPNTIPFNSELENQRVDWAIKQFSTSFFEKHPSSGLKTELPIFIVGAPRSGTTLLEQMLSQHPEIGGAGEQFYWNRYGAEALEALSEDRGKALELSLNYKRLLSSFGPKKKRIIDKSPMNYSALGLLHALFPNARIIHCRRHPVDTCLSLYLNACDMTQVPFGHSREDIVQGYQTYLRLMQHWRETLPAERFLEVDYEHLVQDRETSLRQIVAFCNLEWDDACLSHEKNTRNVLTPSRWQVRQPVYNSSVERWRRYKPWLGAFSSLLTEAELR